MPKITKPFCDTVKPAATGYELYWNDKVSGYGLRVTARGVKAFVAEGRVKGKAVSITIGRFVCTPTSKPARKRKACISRCAR